MYRYQVESDTTAKSDGVPDIQRMEGLMGTGFESSSDRHHTE